MAAQGKGDQGREIAPRRPSYAESKAKHPLCLEGARACPPEDCGGVWSYAESDEGDAEGAAGLEKRRMVLTEKELHCGP